MFFYSSLYYQTWLFFFFFQAEDGIRDLTVTGVQTCALPISLCAMVLPTTSSSVKNTANRIQRTIRPMSPTCLTNPRLKSYSVDRKSTRLNSSHSQISYAVFCLKKKKNTPQADCPTASSRSLS